MSDEQAERAAAEGMAAFLAVLAGGESGPRRFQCVYCAAPYPPGIPPTDGGAVLAHVATCARHPLQAAAARALEDAGPEGPRMNIADALEAAAWPVYLVEVAPNAALTLVRGLRPGQLFPGTIAVRPGTPPPPWETARRLVEDDA